jgi:hypothetical protein
VVRLSMALLCHARPQQQECGGRNSLVRAAWILSSERFLDLLARVAFALHRFFHGGLGLPSLLSLVAHSVLLAARHAGAVLRTTTAPVLLELPA